MGPSIPEEGRMRTSAQHIGGKWIVLLLAAAVAVGAGAGRPVASRATEATGGPSLSIERRLPVRAGGTVTVPVTFDAGNQPISAIVFSIDLDERYLQFEAADKDGDGSPDGVHLLAPAEFNATATYDAADRDGELDIFVADFTMPLATMPDGVLAELRLQAMRPSESTEAAVAFSRSPAPSFGSTSGGSVPGTFSDGSVLITVSGSREMPTPLPAVSESTLGSAGAAPGAGAREGSQEASAASPGAAGSATGMATSTAGGQEATSSGASASGATSLGTAPAVVAATVVAPSAAVGEGGVEAMPEMAGQASAAAPSVSGTQAVAGVNQPAEQMTPGPVPAQAVGGHGGVGPGLVGGVLLVALIAAAAWVVRRRGPA
jgi:hypothetical protein